jgi:hypothetical protein
MRSNPRVNSSSAFTFMATELDNSRITSPDIVELKKIVDRKLTPHSTTRKKDHVDHNDDHASLNYDMPTHEALGYAVPKDIPINSNDRLFYVQVQKDLHTEAEAIKKWSLLSKRFSLDDTGSLVKSYVISGKKKYSLLLGPFSDQSEAIRTAKKIGSGAQIVASPH